MNINTYTTRKLFQLLTLFLALFLSAAFARAQNPSPLPQPLVNIRETGPYLSKIEEIRKLAAEKKYWDFYGEVYTLCEKIRLEQEFATSVNEFSKVELATLEWLYFITASTPQISCEERISVREKFNRLLAEELRSRKIHDADKPKKILGAKLEEMGEWEGDDKALAYKRELCSLFSNEDTSKIAERLSVEKVALDKLHCTYFAEILNSYFVEKRETLEANKKDMGAAYCPRFTLLFPTYGIEDTEVYHKFVFFEKAFQQFDIRQEIRDSMILGTTQCLEQEGAQFVEKLVKSFPQNGPLIREYIKKAGFTSDFACAQLLQRTLGRSAETAYLFKSLPNQKKVAQMEAERIKKEEIEGKELEQKRKKAQEKAAEEIEILKKIWHLELEKRDRREAEKSQREEAKEKSEENSQWKH